MDITLKTKTQHVNNVSEWLDLSVQLYPDKLAFSNGEYGFTFSELQKESKRIATYLIKNKIFRQPIAIHLDKEPKAIAAFLACAYSGNFYVPIDIEMPSSRVQKIYDVVNPKLNINKYNYDEFTRCKIDEDLISGEYGARNKTIDSDLLYILFTSGSTGTPKGVAVSHKSVIEYTEMVQNVFGFNSETIHGQSVPLFFDSSILPIYQTLYCCSSDYMIPRKTLMFPYKTIEFLNKYKCNCIYWVPTSYIMMVNSKIFEKCTPLYLDKCLFMGEVMPVKILNKWKKVLPHALFANLYGPTESTDTFLYYIVDREFQDIESLPLGKPYKNIDVMILNDDNKICNKNEIGEICVRGGKISYGYYNNSKKTNLAFVQNPLNHQYPDIIYRTGDLGYLNDRNEIMYSGRKDFQIKHAGQRIELGEIETNVNAIVGVNLCACVYDNINKQIVLFFCGKADVQQIKNELKLRLQQYMIPTKIYKIDIMPRTPSGKIDRIKLKNWIYK